MVWAIVVVAIAVLGVAAWAGTGKLGEMPGAVTDRPKPHIPDGPVDDDFLETLVLPGAVTGYSRPQVDAVLAAHAAGEDADPGTRFRVVRGGYDMQAVDSVIERFDVDNAVATPSAMGRRAELLPDEDAMNSVEGEKSSVDEPQEMSLSSAVSTPEVLISSSKHKRGVTDLSDPSNGVGEARLREDGGHAG